MTHWEYWVFLLAAMAGAWFAGRNFVRGKWLPALCGFTWAAAWIAVIQRTI